MCPAFSSEEQHLKPTPVPLQDVDLADLSRAKVRTAVVVGLVLAYLVPGVQTAHTSYDELATSERGPVKM